MEHQKHVALGVRRWQKRAKAKRCSQVDLCEQLGATRGEVRSALRGVRRRVCAVEVRSAIAKEVKDVKHRNAQQVVRKLGLNASKSRTARRARQPIRQKLEVERTSKREELRKLEVPIQSEIFGYYKHDTQHARDRRPMARIDMEHGCYDECELFVNASQ